MINYQQKDKKPEKCGFPDFLLDINSQKIIFEITTAHDLDAPNAINKYSPGKTQVISGGITGKISARINSKMTKGNFKNIDSFNLPIVIVVFNNQQSSFIDDTQIDCFMNDFKKQPREAKESLLNNPDYWVIEKVKKYQLISGILFINEQKIKYFPSQNNHLKKEIIKILENPSSF